MYCLELAGEPDDEAFAALEARRAAADAVSVVAPGVATARGVRTERVRHLAYTHRVSELVGRTDASVESAVALLEAASIAREGSVAVRGRNVRATADASTSEAERELGGVLVDRGFSVDLEDPDHELRAVFAGEACYLGWEVAQSVRDFGERRPTDRPFFQPGSMAPLDARAYVNVAAGRSLPDATVLDPMCGTGGILVEAALVGARALGSDAQWKMARGAQENLSALAPRDDWEVVRGDATDLPFRDDAADAIVFDAPYGRQSKIARHELSDLVGGALSEAARVAPSAVLVADRSWEDAAEDAGWRVEERFVRRVHRSLDRHVHVLERV
ncbi:methyltransferase domain-containing protein [Halopelagius longus]|uniref:tRNA (guanine(10)-N(2))-dimethyltransferase n=1 Tax=Halopelagius longus TaxID=1236180 RepID=A0A1H1EDZ1_9EURY|nr:methyltransferase domain-containing protein [Halopelagius longus]RDI71709.1 methyltransferase domain-containing protein [Halopelagius longus]SDQ86748.1 N2-methylguanosine tRNA methyltransferase [Halopelagius longus]